MTELALKTLSVLVLLIVVCVQPGLSRDMIISTMVPAWGSSCKSGSLNLVEGTVFVIELFNPKDAPLQPPDSSWPEGYTLEAALDWKYGTPFSPTPGLVELLQPEYYVSPVNKAESVLLRNNPSRVDARALHTKSFMLQIPEGWAGHTLALRGVYEAAGVRSMSRVKEPIEIVAPCDSADIARAIGSRVFRAYEMADYDAGLLLADSMIVCGLFDAPALYKAMVITRATHDPARELQYLERLFEGYGILSLDVSPHDPPRYNPAAAQNSPLRPKYELRRQKLLSRNARDD